MFLCFLVTVSTVLPWAASQDYRLPSNIVPSKYEIELVVPQGVFLGNNRTFEGMVKIRFTTNTSTSEIKLHHRVSVTNVTVESTSRSIPVKDSEYNNVTEIFTVTLEETLTANTAYTLTIEYHGTLETDNMRGFYISTYKNETNQTSYLVLSKFEPVHARHAFPCLDEPHLKATFVLSLTYPTGYNALANTAIANETTPEEGYTKSIFKETTVMSTYLVAFAISNFTCTEGYSISQDIKHSVCSRPEEALNRAWAVEIGSSLIRTLESMTGIKYGDYMPKMDELAIPDFAAGAMENWGLISYRETYLLWNEEESSNGYKKYVATVIVHELAHQWFGNLVTCKWWDYIFLNEGFATLYEYFGAAATQQLLDWELDKDFIVEVVHTALLADSSASSVALTSPALTASEIAGKFSTISYNKGGSILRMIEKTIMGSDNFVYGIRQYLQTYAQQAAEPSDLWTIFSNFVPANVLPSGANFSTVINNWIELPGHPVISVQKSGNDVILTQARFLLSGNSTTQYYVPVTYTVSNDITTFSNTTAQNWLIPGSSLTLRDSLTDSSWIILNNRQAGFYRVNYDATLWSAIKTQLHSNHLKIDVLNRAQLLNDAFSFARASDNDWTYAEVLDLMSYLKGELDYHPWYAAIVGSNYLLQKIGHESVVGQRLTDWLLVLLQQVYDTVPFELIDDSNQVHSAKQALILTRVCKYRNSDCIAKSKQLFNSYRVNGTKVPKNLRTIVYCNALRSSEDIENDFNFLWQKYRETSLMTEVITILRSLGCAEDKTSLKWLLDQTINVTSGIRLQDFSSVWSSIYSSSSVGTEATFEYIGENYQKLNETYGSVGSLISGAANYIYADNQLTWLEALKNVTGLSSGHLATVESALNTAKQNIEWASGASESVRSYLDQLESGAVHVKVLILLVIGGVFLQNIIT